MGVFTKVWEFFLLTMGVTPKDGDPVLEDKWEEGRRLKEEEDREAREARHRAREARAGAGE